MKYFSRILLASLVAVALAQLCRAHLQLRYNYEALAWEVKGERNLLMANIKADYQRTRRDAQKIAELESKLKVLTAGTNRINDCPGARISRLP